MPSIEHIVVLMMENRSFDHLLGFLPPPHPSFDGVPAGASNPNPFDPSHGVVPATATASFKDVPKDPGHGHDHVMRQLMATPPPWKKPWTPTNQGFVWDYGRQDRPETAGEIMRCFHSARVPVLSRLATEYAVCDRWFCSVPGQTWPNRLFAHCASSEGTVDNDIRLYTKAPSIFETMISAGRTVRIYHDGIYQAAALSNLWPHKIARAFGKFEGDVLSGDLPDYTFIEPDHFWPGNNSQHPTEDVTHGEQLIARVYQAIAAKKEMWESTLLVITYDEHGGFYDHVPPPSATPPNGLPGQHGFDFSLLGPRVPAVLVSPWIEANTVDHTVYDHSSIVATVRKMFGIAAPLTQRDAAANTFAHNLTRATPRPALLDLHFQGKAPLKAASPNTAPSGPLDENQEGLLTLAGLVEAKLGTVPVPLHPVVPVLGSIPGHGAPHLLHAHASVVPLKNGAPVHLQSSQASLLAVHQYQEDVAKLLD